MWKFNGFLLNIKGVTPIHPTTKVTGVLGGLINVDNGKDSEENYFQKFEKVLLADNWLIFITPNKKVKKRLKEIFKEFVKQRIVDGLIGLKKANKKHIILSIPELQSLPNKFYDKFVGKE